MTEEQNDDFYGTHYCITLYLDKYLYSAPLLSSDLQTSEAPAGDTWVYKLRKVWDTVLYSNVLVSTIEPDSDPATVQHDKPHLTPEASTHNPLHWQTTQDQANMTDTNLMELPLKKKSVLVFLSSPRCLTFGRKTRTRCPFSVLIHRCRQAQPLRSEAVWISADPPLNAK